MTTRALAQIQADQRALELETAAYSLPLLEEALAALEDADVLRADMERIRDSLPLGPGRDALGHIVTVLSNGPLALNQQANAARALMASQAA